jgi:hypothetical protein
LKLKARYPRASLFVLSAIRRQHQASIDAILKSEADEVAQVADAGAMGQAPLDLAKLARYERMARADRRCALEILDALKQRRRGKIYSDSLL